MAAPLAAPGMGIGVTAVRPGTEFDVSPASAGSTAADADATRGPAGLMVRRSPVSPGTTARTTGPAPAADPAVAADLPARAARPAAGLGEAAPDAPEELESAYAEAASVPALSADATPTACGPARDSPSANAAAPTRLAVLDLLPAISIETSPICVTTGQTQTVCSRYHPRDR